jgi:glucokinase
MGNGEKDQFWIGFDLGGTKMQALLFDDKLNAKGGNRRKTKGESGAQLGMERIVQTIEQLLDEAKITKKDLAGIGVGVPGPLDLDKGILLESPNLGWNNMPLRKQLEEAFGCPAVVLNDVDAGVYGEYRFGAAKNARCVVGVFPGTGIGGGCVYEGGILRGKNGSCMEIGHIQVLPNGPLCGCGQRGCLEALSSRLAISSAATAAAIRGNAPHLLAARGTDMADIRSRSLAEAIKAGDEIVEKIVRDAAVWLGVGISIAINLLAPDVVVLGGGLVEAMPDLYVKEVERTARLRVMNSLRDSFKVVAATLGDEATATGAAAWARKSIKSSDQRKEGG